MKETFLVFVYGTLRRHERNHFLLKKAKNIAKQCWSTGILYDTGCDYPVMTPHNSRRVYGELYEVNQAQLKSLDFLEGYTGNERTNNYDRILQTVYTDKETVEALVYVQSTTKIGNLNEIKYGDWKCQKYLAQQELLYFAYGSCMDDERFCLSGVQEQFKDVKGCGIAANYSLAYTRNSLDGGKADLVESDEYVEGKVYRIKNEALPYLFKREGVAFSIYRPAFLDVCIDSVIYQDVLTFLVVDKVEEVAPSEYYVTQILRGAKGFVSEVYYKKLQDDLNKRFETTKNFYKP
ncbi:gamma-glutamylcyclotransferase family protein [Sutcliffiella halmapala]|uniref:gamma-glutamylcyclotransferase family protein n=1 Tax=Sutcliffiella halmapala TaxID=79882 RepID=UPI000995BA38|nr:gamma-glutamylcyclotransferase family protein [Sutcliffiella halmapala]